MSNLLCQIYRLRELVKKELGETSFYAAMKVTPERHVTIPDWLRRYLD